MKKKRKPRVHCSECMYWGVSTFDREYGYCMMVTGGFKTSTCARHTCMYAREKGPQRR